MISIHRGSDEANSRAVKRLLPFLMAALLLLGTASGSRVFANGGGALDGLDTDVAATTSSSTAAATKETTSSATATEEVTTMGRINDASGNPPCWWLNLRQGPGHRFPVIKVMKGGSILKVFGKDPESGWYKVSDGVTTGWCGPKYVTAEVGVASLPYGDSTGSASSTASSSSSSSSTSTASTGTSGSSSSSSSGASTGIAGGGAMKAEDFGYDAKYQAVFDIVQKYVDANTAYKLAAGHTANDGYASVTDCSGFVGSFYQKLAALSGIPPVFPKNSWYQTSTLYKNNYTKKVTASFPPTDPKDLIKPGDIFVMDKGSSGYGHVGVFMGYDKSGNPVIAHSTPSKRSSYIYGDTSETGVRVEVLPRSYKDRWAGIYRIDKTDDMIDALSKS